MVMEREKERTCSFTPKKKKKKMIREGKSIKKVLVAEPQTMAEEKPDVDTERWTPDLRPCFFKILHPAQSQEQLRIPPHFMKHLTEDMSNRATLKFSSGRFWNIELRTAIGSMYLQDGWQQFLKDNSLGDNEFLLFKYDGNLCFNVQIFEKSGCQRVPEKHQEIPLPEEKRKRGRPRKCPLAPPLLKSCGDRRGQSDLQLQPEKFEEVNNGKDFLRKIKDEDNSDLSFWGVDSEAKKSKDDKNSLRNIRTGLDSPILKRDSHTRPGSLEMLPPAEKVEEEDIVDFQRVVESFSSSFPYFQMRMERSAVDKAFILHIPTSFSRAHLQNVKTPMVLRNLQGEPWEVNCIRDGGRHSLCGRGWAAFVRWNYLKRGDICIFELVDENEMHVNTFRI